MARNLEALKQAIVDARAAAGKGLSKEIVKTMVEDVVLKSGAVRKSETVVEDDDTDPNTVLKSAESKHRMVNSLILKSSRDPQVQELQDFSDSCYLLHRIIGDHNRREGLPSYDVRKSMHYRLGMQGFSKVMKALNATTAAEGQNWVPTMFSSRLVDLVRLELRVAALFTGFDMPSDPWTLPVAGADAVSKLVGESTTDNPSAMPKTQFATEKVTLISKKHVASIPMSEEIDEDSIIAIAPQIRTNIAIALARGVENALINGDTAGTHMDSDVVSATDVRKSWLGLRILAQSGAKVDEGNDALLATDIRDIRKKLGKYGIDPGSLALVVSMSAYMQLQTLAELITVEKYGAGATILTGEVGRIFGIPVLVSEFVREDLNASGVRDNTTQNRTIAIMVNRKAYCIGTRRAVTLKTFENTETDQTILTGTTRKIFKNYFPSTEQAVSILYNIGS